MTQSQAANLFGGKSFWTFAIGVSVIFAVISSCSEQNEKADAAKETARAKSLATESGAVNTCKAWMYDLYGEGDPAFKVVKTAITRKGEFNYTMDLLIKQTGLASKSVFQYVEDCEVYWSYKEGAWETRVR
ncbi:hypothetical protein HTS88_20980 [Pseudarthrobacter oxydans]|uniref:hypothetical protein n=1 Tax=Pseudarthrobacter oxydans TaxID=1671 RepID=UPI0015727287|nr:hypothetical protein [Pseudarthrobacter oxydans]NSX38856.1 hypothetical protein [Pseudarthrobacter oxydans]